MYLESGVFCQVVDEVIYRACGKGDGRSTCLAEQMVPMSGSAPDIGRVTIRLNDAGKHIDRGENLKRSIDRRSADLRSARRVSELGDKLLGGERAAVTQDRVHDRGSWRGQAVSVIGERLLDIGLGEVVLVG